MDPQSFLRLSIGLLGLRLPHQDAKPRWFTSASAALFHCEISLPGFPVQTAAVPLMRNAEFITDGRSSDVVFSLDEADVKALMTPSIFRPSGAFLEITIYMQQQSSYCTVANRKRRIGIVRIEIGTAWQCSKPLLLHNGWMCIVENRRGRRRVGQELHFCAKIKPDPRYVLQFEDEISMSPQIVQIQGKIRQPIFSCKFIRDQRASPMGPSDGFRTSSGGEETDGGSRDRKGWKVIIHDLSGSAVAAAFMSTPFVPLTNCNRVCRSNPGAWMILCPDPKGTSESWCPWGRLEAWREPGPKDSVFLRLYLLPEGGDVQVLASEALISSDKGGEFFIDMDKQAPIVPATDDTGFATRRAGSRIPGGFVMSCRVDGEDRVGKTAVQVAKQYVTCTEDAAIFMALAAAVHLSMKACKPFRMRSRG